MHSLQEQLTAIFTAAFTELGLDVEAAGVTVSQRPDIAQFQCNGALREAKKAGVQPRELADKIIQSVMQHPNHDAAIDTLAVEGPGFINIRVKSSFVASRTSELLEDDRQGVVASQAAKKITVDFGGLNVAKPMHVGHLRSLMIGESLKRILRFLGHEVTGDVHLGDWGTQMGMIITQLEIEQPDLPYFSDEDLDVYPTEAPFTLESLDRIYPEASGRCKEDPEAMAAALAATAALQAGRPGYLALWKHIVNVSVTELKKDVAFLGVEFELWNGESTYHEWCGQMIERLKNAGYAKESQGALIIELPELPEDTKEMPPLLLTKSDGAYLYGTSDLAAVDERVQEFHDDLLLYVVDDRQSLHFKQVFRAARITGIAPANVELFHAGFGTVNGLDGKPFKTRAGGTMKLRELVDMAILGAEEQMLKAEVGGEYTAMERKDISKLVGLAALKYADLMNHRQSSYIFDVEKFTQFEGKTGPYLLYAAVRMQSVLRKAREANLNNGAGVTSGNRVVDAEMYPDPVGSRAITDLSLRLLALPEVLTLTTQEYTPHVLAEHAFVLAQAFHHFYAHCPIMKEENPNTQSELLALVKATHKQLVLVLTLLGIDVPEKM